MGIDYGVFCDTCEVWADLGEWLFTENHFQKTRTLWHFIEEHNGHQISLYCDAEEEHLDRCYEPGNYKEVLLHPTHWNVFVEVPLEEES